MSSNYIVMMQWTDGVDNRPTYSSSSPHSDLSSGVNTSGVASGLATSNVEVKREIGDIGRNNTTTTDHLQSCLSMLPQSYSCKLLELFTSKHSDCNCNIEIRNIHC